WPVVASKARKRRSFVAPTNTRPPAVTVGPALPEFPTSCLPSGSSSITPSGTDHLIAPLFASTATSSPHGGLKHGACGPCGRPLSSYSPDNGALNEKNGPLPSTLAWS